MRISGDGKTNLKASRANGADPGGFCRKVRYGGYGELCGNNLQNCKKSGGDMLTKFLLSVMQQTR